MKDIDIKKMKSKLDGVSSSMCLAKWVQVTLHLHLGHNHSCHHPDTHKISQKEITENPSALHNTKFKLGVRKSMLAGERPDECKYCWCVEDSNKSAVSDRILKSSSEWAKPYFDEVVQSGLGEKISPRYLEVSFSHACNFKCSYCAPHFSSAWEKEIKKHGPYMLDRVFNGVGINSFHGKKPLSLDKPNPYVKAFWEWLPEIYNDLKVLRVTGGEPLLSKDTFKLFDKIKNTPNPNIKLAVNTNLGVPDKTIDKTINMLKTFKTGYHVEKLQIFTSVDTWGGQAEYIRNGLNFNKFWSNLERVLIELPEVDITIMCTFNNLSVPGFKEFLENYLKLKHKVFPQRAAGNFLLDISYLKSPVHQSYLLLPRDYSVPKLEECVKFMQENSTAVDVWTSPDFINYEVVKMERLLEVLKNEPVDIQQQNAQQANFYKFFTEHDKRRGTDFLTSFPELNCFWQSCEASAKTVANYPNINILHTAAWALTKTKNKLKLNASKN